MSRDCRGISLTPFLIIFIILTFLASVLAFMFSSQVEDQKRFTKNAQMEAKKMKKLYDERWEEVRRLREVLGFFQEAGEGAGDSTVTDVGIVQAELDKLNTTEILGTPSGVKPLTVKEILKELNRRVNTIKQEINNAKLERDNFQQHWKDEEVSKRDLIREKGTEIQDLRDRAQRAQERLNQEVQQKEGQITELRDRNQTLHAELEKSEAEKQARVQDLTGQIRKTRSRLDKLVDVEKRQETLIPDGEVIRADIDHGFAYIDLGWKHGVKPGSRFKVYEVLKGGRRKEKGEIRIVRVEKDFCQCSILAQDDVTNPIVKGDYVWNKFFEKNVKKVFVFVGKFDTENSKYSKEQLKKIIEENGHIATEVARSDTDYAVIGEEYQSDPQLKTVNDYKIEKIAPSELLDFFGIGTYRRE